MKIYKLLSLVILTFGLLHMFYPFFYPKPFGEELMWFFSGGISMLLSSSLNYVNSKSNLQILEKLTLYCNTMTTVFFIVLSIAVKEIQIFALLVVFLTATFISFKKANQLA